MWSIGFCFGYFFLVFCIQDSSVLSDGITKYKFFDEDKTWDDANDLCRQQNMALPFILNLEDENGLTKYLKDNQLGPPVDGNGYWLGGRAEGTILRWDFGSKSIVYGYWHTKEPAYDKRDSDGVVKACLEIKNKKETKFISGGIAWSTAWCDETRKVICQSYE